VDAKGLIVDGTMPMTVAAGQSKLETLKKGSHALRGRLAEGLASDQPAFDDAGYSLLKFTASIRATTATVRPSASSTVSPRSTR